MDDCIYTTMDGRLMEESHQSEVSGDPLYVAVVGNVKMYREGLRLFVDSLDDVGVVSCLSEPEQLIQCCEEWDVEVVLVDARMAGILPILEHVSAQLPDLRFIILAVRLSSADVRPYLDLHNVVDILIEEDSFDELAFAINAARLNRFISTTTLGRVMLQKAPVRVTDETPQTFKPPLAAPALPLTRRQQVVLELIEQGQSNKQIARALDIEINTVKNHVHEILRRLHVANRCEAASVLRHLS